MDKLKIRKTRIKKLTASSFIVGKRYSITWANLGKQVVSKGRVVTGGSAKFICFQDDKLNAVTIIPINLITSHKSL